MENAAVQRFGLSSHEDRWPVRIKFSRGGRRDSVFGVDGQRQLSSWCLCRAWSEDLLRCRPFYSRGKAWDGGTSRLGSRTSPTTATSPLIDGNRLKSASAFYCFSNIFFVAFLMGAFTVQLRKLVERKCICTYIKADYSVRVGSTIRSFSYPN